MEYPKRKLLRLQTFDYSQNYAYFVTICTQNRKPILSEVCRGGALLRPEGEIVKTQILELAERFRVQVDHYVIMPNHIHMIVLLQRAEQSPAPTENHAGQADKPQPGLSDMICALKSISTKKINALHGCAGRQVWQRSFHDHIIRNQSDYLEIWQYIDENPLKWTLDRFYVDTD